MPFIGVDISIGRAPEVNTNVEVTCGGPSVKCIEGEVVIVAGGREVVTDLISPNMDLQGWKLFRNNLAHKPPWATVPKTSPNVP